LFYPLLGHCDELVKFTILPSGARKMPSVSLAYSENVTCCNGLITLLISSTIKSPGQSLHDFHCQNPSCHAKSIINHEVLSGTIAPEVAASASSHLLAAFGSKTLVSCNELFHSVG
jgi:hypothetical protein